MSERKEKFGIGISVPVPFLQKDLEAYQVELQNQLEGVKTSSGAVINRKILSACIVIGWVDGISVADLPGLEAYKIAWASKEVIAQVEIAQAIPKK